MALSKEDRAEIRRRGEMPIFSKRASQLRKDGYSDDEAQSQAAVELLNPDLAEEIDRIAEIAKEESRRGKKETPPAGRPSKDTKINNEKDTPPPCPSLGSSSLTRSSNARNSKVKKRADEQLKNLPSTSKPVDLICWVAGNLQGEVDWKSCPGRDAYALLMQCQRSPGFEVDFWKTMYTKVIPSRAEVGNDEGVVELDGESTIKVLDKIGKIVKDLKG